MRKLALFFVALVMSCGPARPMQTMPAPPVIATAEVVDPPPPAALEPPQPTLRLPKNFVPKHYTARLAIDPAKDGFDGSISIAGNVTEASSVIWLHGYKLDVGKAVAQRDGAEVALTVTPKGTDLLELRAASPLAAGEWTLDLEYTGTLDQVSTTGAFKQTVAGHSYVFTQLEAVYARRVFPCVDEPDSKVPWKLALDVPKHLVAVANAPQVHEKMLDGTTKQVEFAVTKPLPTYLVAFAVGPFEIVDAGTSTRGTPVRVITLAKRAAEAAYAAKTSAKLLDFTEEWFGSPYPYAKLDMISIPITVGFGAMENAGLITYTETLILLGDKASKARHRRWIVVAAHEIAHQWFGNLVTPAFWDDIWLNEGFANWLEYKVSSRFEPTWRDREGALGTRNSALEADELVSARRVHQPIESPDDIYNAFDRITYDKGASVLNMFESYIGPVVFQRGVREYLAGRAWGNATSKDFITAISQAAAAEKPELSADQLAAGFLSFLDQPGAPEITATLSCKGGKAELALAQQRYVPPGSPEPAATTPWTVPVCVAYDKAGRRAEACTLMTGATATMALAARSCPRWVMPNVHGRGYYRNAYTVAQVTALRDEAWPKLSWTERRALHFDVSEAAANGKLPLQLALSFVPRMLAGNDRFTVGPALELPASLDRLVPDDLRGKYQHWLRATFGRGAIKAGLTPKERDSLDVEVMRAQLVGTIAWTAREPTLVAAAVRLADHWRDLPQAIRGLVLQIAVDARADVFDRILRDVVTESHRARRQEMYGALASVRDVARQQRALALVLEPKLDLRETMWMLFGATTDANRAIAQQFFRDHQAAIMKRMPKAETVSPLARISRLFTATCQADQRDAIAAYVTQTFGSLPGGARAVAQSIESMDQCIARRKLLDPEIRAWLGGLRLPAPKS